jgi:hypothetical protein
MQNSATDDGSHRTGSLGTGPARIRPSNLRALLGLSVALVLRLLREGLVVRALAWPGLLTALSMFLSASATIAWRSSPVLYVSDAALVAPFEAAEFLVTVDPNPEATLRDGRSERAVWREGDRLVLGATWGGALTNKAEALLRDMVGERWRLEIPPPPRRSRDSVELNPVTGLLAGVVGLLFTLYGVVIGAGSLYRDRSSGVLESDLALAVPRWTHAAARLLALAAVLGPALVVSLVVVDALLPIFRVGAWMFDGFIAAVAGGILGVVLMARADSGRGFSAPLSQALTASMALISIGFWRPGVGRMIPICSLGSAFATVHSSWVVVPVTLVAAVAVSAWFQRRECV